MRQILRILAEGGLQAWQQLMGNKLRSFLSLLGVTIGIFCIIGVKSSVNSLEDNIRNSLNKLGNDVIYVDRFSWGEDPGKNYWKWMRRPNFSFEEFEALKNRLKTADLVGFWQFVGVKTVKYHTSDVPDTYFIGVTNHCDALFNLEFEGEGRFFSPLEYQSGSEVCLLGYSVAEGLFGAGFPIDPLGKQVQVGGRKLRVVGILKKSGNDLIKPFNFDEGILVSSNLARRGFNVRRNGDGPQSSILVKAKKDADLDEVKDEIVGVMRAKRGLSPREGNNFATNTLSLIANVFDNVFGVMNLAGFVIGIFALVVGMFSVANIMFVSVKERTNLIGIKMALGAKRWFILLEILFEAITLCIVGGLIGLLLIWTVAKGISSAIDFNIYLSANNVLIGIVTSIVVGVLSGLIPASQAARMDPVEAIRK
jgi:putative ABC transport system permease protein